ncbi:MAG: YdbL family protein [Candidatus Brocadia sp.]|nr:MAG: YdbL family protein [Candidatus Brocadia sp.]
MKIKMCMSFFIVTLIGVGLTGASLRAEDISTVKVQMEKRLPLIVELKSRGIVGEDRMGYLQFVGGKREKEDVVQAENQDRRKVYEVISQKEGVTIEQVGQRRALQIVNKAKKGEWLQDQNGKWYQK